MCKDCQCDKYISETMPADEVSRDVEKEEKIKLERDILHENNHAATDNRAYFRRHHIFSINMVSSPGSGKTAILEETLKRLKNIYPLSVIEGDLQTDNDARRIKATGVDCLQINTHNGCHLDAFMISKAIVKLHVPKNSLLFIENVGNLVCPALFDLGEQLRVVVMSVTEGDDKPLKYPYMFEKADVCIINKTDLLPYLPSRIETIKENLLSINPNITVFEMSASTGTGVKRWCEFLLNLVMPVVV
ncbi:MAG: hydrogenase nickel incorporation protein HypB [Bacteroidales bacterium]